MSILFDREKKYQFLKLMHSGISLHEANLMARIVGVASMRGYMSEGDRDTLLQIIDKLDKFAGLLETRKQKRKKVIKKYSRGRGEDKIAQFFSQGGYTSSLNQPIDWNRRGILTRKVMKERAPTRAGSSAGKIGKTTVIGHKKLNKDIDKLANSMNQMIKSFESIGDRAGGQKARQKAVGDFISSIRTSVSIKR
jgi:hypothetical protein